MWTFLKKLINHLRPTQRNINIENVHDSTINLEIYEGHTSIVNRAPFIPSDNWFNELLAISFDEEVKSKYIPELHESNNFERDSLNDILNFQQQINFITIQLSICEDYIARFKNSYRDFYQVVDSESISIINSSYHLLSQINSLSLNLLEVEGNLSNLKGEFNSTTKYEILSIRNQLTNITNPISNIVSFRRENWVDFLDKEPKASHVLNNVFQHHNQVYYELNTLNQLLERFKHHSSYKIISGNAGTGKTHISAHLVEKIRANGDYVLFFKSKQFNGDNINLNDRFLQLLNVPLGYTLNEIIDLLNDFASRQNKRCFIIIDALNETTKSSIGFSSIWNNYLQDFINQVGLYSHLYFVCTLRTSYIDHIWSVKPPLLSELKGFDNTNDLQALCCKYFKYFKISITNFDTADLDIFKVPLLLDLYCKLINPSIESEVEIELGMKTYLYIFEEYINNVSREVQRKLNLQMRTLIEEGFTKSSECFFQNNEATILIDSFSGAFDHDPSVSRDNSIARAVLEGYLIFIKDITNSNIEIVKHTQQEVGGYLLARFLSEKFDSIQELLCNKEFNEKIISDNPTNQHQLRLDILKFLIAIRPEIIKELKISEGIALSWWYLYNGFNSILGDEIPNYLLSLPTNSIDIEEILNYSSRHWFNPDNKFNFHFVAKVLENLDLWSFDVLWTFFIYRESAFFYELIKEKIALINEKEIEYNKVVAKFIAFTTATTIRELRDLATIYLIEFGKKHPIELLELTEYSTCLTDEYIYERLASCCYGVSLILQNDDEFVINVLPQIAEKLYKLQFAEDAKHPVFNYIVIDSIKHLIDLSIKKGVFVLSESDESRMGKYKFNPPYEWIDPTNEQQTLINNSNEMSWPEPIGMDFGIYTIPRLIKDDYSKHRIAVANVYKRVFELGYQLSDFSNFDDENFKNFFFGKTTYYNKGKVDRLGKKYSWKSFFDFAGVLLLNDKLNVFEKYSGKKYYERLSDIDIDICLPNRKYKKTIRLFTQDLIIDRNNNPEWYIDIKIDLIKELFEHSFEGTPYIMLHGKIEQRIDEAYETRSFLLAETYFIKKNKHFESAKKVNEITFSDWKLDIDNTPDRLSKVYFGELYWSDNITEYKDEGLSIPTGKISTFKRKVRIQNIFQEPRSEFEDIGKKLEEKVDEKLYFQSQATLLEYLWESNSEVLKGYSEYYPSLRMGKSLGLKADPLTGKILDSDLNDCFNCVAFEDQYFSNDFNYLRSDLLRKYMQENDFALLYQVKQHSYDTDHRNKRSMKLFILE